MYTHSSIASSLGTTRALVSIGSAFISAPPVADKRGGAEPLGVYAPVKKSSADDDEERRLGVDEIEQAELRRRQRFSWLTEGGISSCAIIGS